MMNLMSLNNTSLVEVEEFIFEIEQEQEEIREEAREVVRQCMEERMIYEWGNPYYRCDYVEW